MAALTKYHKLVGLTTEIDPLTVVESMIRVASEIRVSGGLVSSKASEGELIPCLSVSFWNLLALLAFPGLRLQASISAFDLILPCVPVSQISLSFLFEGHLLRDLRSILLQIDLILRSLIISAKTLFSNKITFTSMDVSLWTSLFGEILFNPLWGVKWLYPQEVKEGFPLWLVSPKSYIWLNTLSKS